MPANKQHPPHWDEVYESLEEQSFFIALSRHPKHKWLSVAAICDASKLPPTVVESLIAKYRSCGLVLPCPDNRTMWGYWENNQELLTAPSKPLVELDHHHRLSRHGGWSNEVYSTSFEEKNEQVAFSQAENFSPSIKQTAFVVMPTYLFATTCSSWVVAPYPTCSF